MDDVTIISYPSARDNALLSLTHERSRYMLPFGGRFRVVDFTLRNSFSCGARSTILYNDREDGLEAYVERYGPFTDQHFPPVKVVTRDFSDISFCYNLILDTNTAYYIIYSGDNPSLIDFHGIMDRYTSSGAGAMLFMLEVDGKPTMAHKILVADQKTILDVINSAIEEKRKSPNLFEMLINIMINQGIRRDVFSALYWPIRNIPEYYALHWEMIWDRNLSEMLFREKIIKSKIIGETFAQLGPSAKVSGSFISDYCYINGRVENSVVYPGVEIGENTFIRDSIILPFVRIGAGTRIVRTIVDERTDLAPESDYLNIGENCRVGSDGDNLKNSDFPRSLFGGLTLIGRDCRIINANIGGACYVAPGLGEDYFSKKKYLYDGYSVV